MKGVQCLKFEGKGVISTRDCEENPKLLLTQCFFGSEMEHCLENAQLPAGGHSETNLCSAQVPDIARVKSDCFPSTILFFACSLGSLPGESPLGREHPWMLNICSSCKTSAGGIKEESGCPLGRTLLPKLCLATSAQLGSCELGRKNQMVPIPCPGAKMGSHSVVHCGALQNPGCVGAHSCQAHRRQPCSPAYHISILFPPPMASKIIFLLVPARGYRVE